MANLDSALVGLVGVFFGILTNELVRRRNRIEGYASRVFDKRLEIYEGLYQRITSAGDVGRDVIENAGYTAETRHALVSASIHGIAEWCDRHDMYVNEELTVHCVALLMGVEEIFALSDTDEKDERTRRFSGDLVHAKRMIRKECGIEDIEKMFVGIVKPRRTSVIIDYYRAQRKKLRLGGRTS
jgi:hypothetical protein